MIYIPKKDFEGPEEEPEFKVNFYLPRRNHLVRELIETEVAYESKESKLENKIKLSIHDSSLSTISKFKTWAKDYNKRIATAPDIYRYLQQIVEENNTQEIDRMKQILEKEQILLTDTAVHYNQSSRQSTAVHDSINPYENKLGILCDNRNFYHQTKNHSKFVHGLLGTQDKHDKIQEVFERIKGDNKIELWTYESSLDVKTQVGLFIKDDKLQILADIKNNEKGRIMLVE